MGHLRERYDQWFWILIQDFCSQVYWLNFKSELSDFVASTHSLPAHVTV